MTNDHASPPKQKIRFRVKCHNNRNLPILRIVSVSDGPLLDDNTFKTNVFVEAELSNACLDLKWKEVQG